MITSLNDTYKTVNGVEVPGIGFGTWQVDSETASESVKNAIGVGYRHIDTAAMYGNEEGVGEGIRKSGVKREDIFLATKHMCDSRGYTRTIKACEKSLKRLGTDYLDLYLIHWPCVDVSTDRWKEINASTWRGFEELLRQGKIRAIGVSNFTPEHLIALKELTGNLPMVNQIEIHPGYDQPANVSWCQKNGILVEAWSPLGCGAVLESYTIKKIAAKYSKTEAQICIRYVAQLGVIPVLKTVHVERMSSNADIFDFEISEDDMAIIKTMPGIGFSGCHPATAPVDDLFPGCNYDED